MPPPLALRWPRSIGRAKLRLAVVPRSRRGETSSETHGRRAWLPVKLIAAPLLPAPRRECARVTGQAGEIGQDSAVQGGTLTLDKTVGFRIC